MVANAILLVRGAKGDGGDDRSSVRIWIRPNMDGPSAKAVKLFLVDLSEMGRSNDR